MEITLKSGEVSAKITSTGAELKSLKVGNRELMWSADPAFWGKTSPLLFPMIGTLKDGKTLINGSEYKITKHGFARDLELTPEDFSSTSAMFSLTQSDYTKAMFPFDFRFTVRYTLKADGLTVTYRVHNTSNSDMPFCIGAHPAFACQIGDHLLFEKNETLDTVAIDTECLRTSQMIPVLRENNVITITKNIFDNDALIFNGMKSSYITLGSDSHNRKIKFDFGDCPYLGIWAKPGASYVCLEPWWGVNDSHEKKDDFSQKDAIQSVGAGKTYTCYWQAEIIE